MYEYILNLLRSIWSWLIARDLPKTHWRRYVLGAAATSVFFISLSVVYLKIAPKSYTSSWSLILPGAGVNAKFSLDDIGQASTSSSSPYSSSTLSPKVNYQTIITSNNIIKKAAKSMNMELNAFGKPRTKLVTQTSLILLKSKASSPELAQKKAWALYNTFDKELNRLRSDEIGRRTTAVQLSLKKVKENLDKTRNALTEFRSKTGLLSLDQFNTTVNTLENLRKQSVEARAQMKVLQIEVSSLSAILNLQPDEAAMAMRLNADTSYRSFTRAHNEARTKLATLSHKYGVRNAHLIETRRDVDNTRNAIVSYIEDNYPSIDDHFIVTLFSIDNANMEDILKRLVIRHSEYLGQKGKVDQIYKLIIELEKQGSADNETASKLEELEREHKIAKAVFSSTLARIDSSQADPYASYPLVQVLERPTLPTKPSSPKKIFVILGGIVAAFLSVIAWLFAWLHQWFIFIRIEKKIDVFFPQNNLDSKA